MKTNYGGHEGAYKKRKKDGRAGWDTAEGTQETIALLEKVLQAEYVPKSGKLLELGCGAGDITLWFAEKGYDIYGVDLAPTAIAWAQEKAEERNLQADFQVGNVLELQNYTDDFFDFVLDGHCFHCIIGDDRKLFLESAYRTLKPGGFLHVNTMCGEVTNEELKKHYDPQSRCHIYKGIASRYIGLADDILGEIRNAGFQILHWEVELSKEGAPDQDNLLVNAIKPR